MERTTRQHLTALLFFNSVHIRALPKFLSHHGPMSNLQADLCLFAFFLSAIILVIAVIALPAWIALRQPSERSPRRKEPSLILSVLDWASCALNWA